MMKNNSKLFALLLVLTHVGCAQVVKIQPLSSAEIAELNKPILSSVDIAELKSINPGKKFKELSQAEQEQCFAVLKKAFANVNTDTFSRAYCITRPDPIECLEKRKEVQAAAKNMMANQAIFAANMGDLEPMVWVGALSFSKKCVVSAPDLTDQSDARAAIKIAQITDEVVKEIGADDLLSSKIEAFFKKNIVQNEASDY